LRGRLVPEGISLPEAGARARERGRVKPLRSMFHLLHLRRLKLILGGALYGTLEVKIHDHM